MCKCNANKVDRVVVKLFDVRPIISNVLTVFVLRVLLIVISYATRVFAKNYIDGCSSQPNHSSGPRNLVSLGTDFWYFTK